MYPKGPSIQIVDNQGPHGFLDRYFGPIVFRYLDPTGRSCVGVSGLGVLFRGLGN